MHHLQFFVQLRKRSRQIDSRGSSGDACHNSTLWKERLCLGNEFKEAILKEEGGGGPVCMEGSWAINEGCKG